MSYIRRSWTSTIASICIALALVSGLAAHAMLSSQAGVQPPQADVPAARPKDEKLESLGLPFVMPDIFNSEATRRRQSERKAAETVSILTNWVQENSKYGGRLTTEAARKIVLTTMAASHAAGLDPILILALIKIESNFDPKAVSSAGAIGLTQITPFWHADKGVTAKSALNPEFNINAGVKILVEYLGWHKGDLRKALLQYNGSLNIKGAKYADNVLSMKAKINKFVESQRYKQAQEAAVQTADWIDLQWVEPSKL